MKRVAINGTGRIGRAAIKILIEAPGVQLVAVNDIAPIETIAYLLQYDSVHGTFDKKVTFENEKLLVGDISIQYLSERDPSKLPWRSLGIDVVIESTGLFTNEEDAAKHIKAGAATVILSGPTKSVNVPTVVHGVNSAKGGTHIFSCASCTTNNISPIIEVLGRHIGIKKAILNTIHADTASNSIVDAPNRKNPRMGRSGINNLIPTTTGAAIATTKAMPQYTGKFDGIAVRVPVVIGSLSDITLVTERLTSVVEVNQILTAESQTPQYKGILGVTDQPLVSSDIVKSPFASLADLSMTKVVDGDLVKVLSWYDNEWGFTHQMVREIIAL